jgi:hypothetical protein
MPMFLFVIKAPRKAVKADSTNRIVGPNHDAADLPASILAPSTNVSCQFHETGIPVSHIPSSELFRWGTLRGKIPGARNVFVELKDFACSRKLLIDDREECHARTTHPAARR